VARVNILRRIKTSKGWANVALKRNTKKRIQWPSGGRFLIEWRENGKRLRASAGETPAEALEAQKRKRLELGAKESGLEEEDASIPLQKAVETLILAIRNPPGILGFHNFSPDKTPPAKFVRFNLVNLYKNCSTKCPRRPLKRGRLACSRQI